VGELLLQLGGDAGDVSGELSQTQVDIAVARIREAADKVFVHPRRRDVEHFLLVFLSSLLRIHEQIPTTKARFATAYSHLAMAGKPHPIGSKERLPRLPLTVR
jgi:hypothetical protein